MSTARTRAPRNDGVVPNAVDARLSAAVAALSLAITIPLFDSGGFSTGSRSLFVALAALSVLCAMGVRGGQLASTAGSSVAVTLAVIALISLVSAVWTVTGALTTIRWALVIAGYAAVAVSARIIRGRVGGRVFATALIVLAVTEAAVGLVSVAYHVLPDAERLYGVWRPGGTFEYQPALALLEVSALLPLQRMLSSASRWTSIVAAAALPLVGASLGLSGDRLAPALAVLELVGVLAYRLAAAHRGSQRHDHELASVFGSGALLLASAALSPLVLGGHVSAGAAGAGTRGIAELAAVAGGGALLWAGMRTLRTGWLVVAAVTACVLACGGLVGNRAGSAVQGPRGLPGTGRAAVHHHPPVAPASGGLLHGRGAQWRAALDTWLDRPLLGSGADSYYVASFKHQPAALALYAHDLPLEFGAELGIPGFALALLLYAATTRLLWRARHDACFALLGPLCAFFLISNLVDWTWHFAAFGAMWAAGCGVLSARAETPEPALWRSGE